MAGRGGRREREEEDDTGLGQRACLPLRREGDGSGEEEDPDAPPMDGYEYLRRVRMDARKRPRTVVAVQRDSAMGAAARVVEAPVMARYLPAELVPARPWRRAVLLRFRAVRGQLAQLRKAAAAAPPDGLPADRFDKTKWKAYCLGGAVRAAQEPTLPVVLALDQAQTRWLLTRHKDWLCSSPHLHDLGDAKVSSRGHHLQAMALQVLGAGAGRAGSAAWLYALLASVEDNTLGGDDKAALAGLVYSLCDLWQHMAAWGWGPVTTAPPAAGGGAAVPCPSVPAGYDTTRAVGCVASLVAIVHSHFRQGNPELLWPWDG